jgi:hypothetical protein
MVFTATFVFLVQGLSLFRSYPSSPVCGRVINVLGNLNVLINCDSAIFMKDAQNPMRMFVGSSVYQDRPAHSALVWLIGSLLRFIGFPNQSREIVGTSGQITTYESIFYLIFVAINFIIIFVAAMLAIKFVFGKFAITSLARTNTMLIIVLLIVSANELTKTFFWTPHSQMFNILLPTMGLTLLKNRKNPISIKQFVPLNMITLVLMFFYPLFGLLFIILLFTQCGDFVKRLITVVFFVSIYLLYPTVLEFFGGDHRNFVVEEYRQYVWLFDSIREKNLVESLGINLELFASTFPLIPTALLIASAIFFTYVIRESSVQIRKKIISNLMPYLLFFAIYIGSLSMMGYYSRRLTLGPYIFLELVFIKFITPILAESFKSSQRVMLILLFGLLLGSWVLTNGPLS